MDNTGRFENCSLWEHRVCGWLSSNIDWLSRNAVIPLKGNIAIGHFYFQGFFLSWSFWNYSYQISSAIPSMLSKLQLLFYSLLKDECLFPEICWLLFLNHLGIINHRFLHTPSVHHCSVKCCTFLQPRGYYFSKQTLTDSNCECVPLEICAIAATVYHRAVLNSCQWRKSCAMYSRWFRLLMSSYSR